MQPSDSLASVGRGFGSPCRRPTSMRALITGLPRMRSQMRGASETDHRLSASPVAVEEKRGPPRFLGRPLRACRGRTPRRIQPLLAHNQRRGRRRLQGKQNPGHPGWHRFRGRKPHGPHARVPTLRRPRCQDRRQARYRLGRAHPWPDGLRTRWTTNEVSWSHRSLHSPSTSSAWSHWSSYPLSIISTALTRPS